MNGPIPARAVTGLLAEILNALDAGHGQALPAVPRTWCARCATFSPGLPRPRAT